MFVEKHFHVNFNFFAIVFLQIAINTITGLQKSIKSLYKSQQSYDIGLVYEYLNISQCFWYANILFDLTTILPKKLFF